MRARRLAQFRGAPGRGPGRDLGPVALPLSGCSGQPPRRPPPAAIQCVSRIRRRAGASGPAMCVTIARARPGRAGFTARHPRASGCRCGLLMAEGRGEEHRQGATAGISGPVGQRICRILSPLPQLLSDVHTAASRRRPRARHSRSASDSLTWYVYHLLTLVGDVESPPGRRSPPSRNSLLTRDTSGPTLR